MQPKQFKSQVPFEIMVRFSSLRTVSGLAPTFLIAFEICRFVAPNSFFPMAARSTIFKVDFTSVVPYRAN